MLDWGIAGEGRVCDIAGMNTAAEGLMSPPRCDTLPVPGADRAHRSHHLNQSARYPSPRCASLGMEPWSD